MLLFEVVTDGDLTEKKRVADREDIEIDSNHVIWVGGSDFVEFIYHLDAERIPHMAAHPAIAKRRVAAAG